MTLQTSGAISLSQVNVELNLSATAKISLNDAAVRKLLGKASGAISMRDAYGKSHEIRFVNTVARTSVSIFELMGSPTEPGIYIFENKAEITASTASYALRTGVFPTGSTLTIINHGYIRGMGGAGSSAVATPGGAGGDVIYLDMSCRIDNSVGYILAGGGGGGSAQRVASTIPTDHMRAGGGGGAGLTIGAAGVNSFVGMGPESNVAPVAGTSTAAGAGGSIIAGNPGTYLDFVYGGAGGANGAAGAKGSTKNEGSNTYKDTPTVGVAGAAGRAIVSNGKSLTQVSGFNSVQIKGAIV